MVTASIPVVESTPVELLAGKTVSEFHTGVAIPQNPTNANDRNHSTKSVLQAGFAAGTIVWGWKTDLGSAQAVNRIQFITGRHVSDVQGEPSGQKVGQSGQQPAGGLLGRGLPTDDRDFAAASLEPNAEGVLDGPQVFVGDSEERGQSGFGEGYGVAGFRNRRCSLRR